MFYDSENVEKAWEKLKLLYLEEKLPGIINISKAKFPDFSGGYAIGAYCGPFTDEEHCIKVGKLLVKVLKHKRQQCNIVNNWPHKKFIYFKKITIKNKNRQSSEKEEPLYRVPYK